MWRRIGFGVLWAVAIYTLVEAVIAGVAGGIAGAQNPQNAAAAGQEAGRAAVRGIRLYILLTSVGLAALGTWLAILPGTWRTKAEPLPTDASNGGPST